MKKDKKSKDFKYTYPEYKDATMRDVRDALSRGEGLSDKEYPHNQKLDFPKDKRNGCLTLIIGFLKRE